MEMFYAIIGWLGVFVFVLSYLLLSLDILSSKKTTYHWLNVIGSILLVFNGFAFKDYPSITVNAIWGIIALLTIVKLITTSINCNKIKQT